MTAKVKICGLKTEATLTAALAAGADYVGLVFYPPSPRFVTPDEAGRLAAMARGARVKVVALLVDADDKLVDEVAAKVRPDLMQLHGAETAQRCRDIRSRTSIPVMKAIKVETQADAEQAYAYVQACEMVLFDAKAPKGMAGALPGGNGLSFDWRLIAGMAGKFPFMLSGGLTPENVAAAIRLTGAGAVDVSSGVETTPGVKDAGLIQHFLAAAKAA